MKKTKFTTLVLSVIMAFALCIGFFPAFGLEVRAENDEEVINSSEWNYPTAAVTPDWTGEGTEASPYMISTPQQLADLAYLVNNADTSSAETCYAGVHFKLANSLDLNPGFTATEDGFTDNNNGTPKAWTPIGALNYFGGVDQAFYGFFDGDGHTISGIYLGSNCCSNDSAGLFAYADIYDNVDGSGGIKNLKIANSYADIDNDTNGGGCAAVGLLVGLNCTKVENCHVSGYVNVNDKEGGAFDGVGGVMGQNNNYNSIASKCSFRGKVSYTGGWISGIGGIAGTNAGYIEDCINYGDVVSDYEIVGGITGYNYNYDKEENTEYTDAGTIKGCENHGNITGGEQEVGGIVGHSGYLWYSGCSQTKIIDCKNYGAVVGGNDPWAGGIVGYMHWADIENCHNYGSVSNQDASASTAKTGAIVGWLKDQCSLTDCTYLQNDTVNKDLPAVNIADGVTDYVDTNVKAISTPHNGEKQDGQAATCTQDGWQDYYKCDHCDKYFTEQECENEITDLEEWKKGAGKIQAQHTHSTDWSKNDTHHWHECDCGDKADYAEHSYGEWTVTKEATATEDGLKERSCACGEKETEVIPADNKGLSGGAIAGIVIGSVAVIGLGGFLIFWFVIKKKK